MGFYVNNSQSPTGIAGDSHFLTFAIAILALRVGIYL